MSYGWLDGRLAATVVVLSCTALFGCATTRQAHYESPEQAAQALIDAAANEEDNAELREVLGPDAESFLSGDPVEDANNRSDFVEQSLLAAGIEQIPGEDDRATLVIGEDDWPFPVPLEKDWRGWYFDTEAGLEEIYARRIGRNELYAIAVAEDFAQAQFEYAELAQDQDGDLTFARKFFSDEGKRNGLYWPTSEEESPSPLGPLLAEASAEGYRRNTGEDPLPYHGYFYRILERQGSNAPGGALEYVMNGRMSEGFGLLAYPSDYGNSGVMTFIVNQQGIVYEKDLGEQTAEQAVEIDGFDPDPSWDPVTE